MSIRKKRLYLFIGLLMVFIVVGFFGYRFSHPTVKVGTAQTPSCSNGSPAHKSLAASTDPILRKLHEYEIVCKGSVVDTVMFFTAMPTTADEASTLAQNAAVRLKEFSKYNIKPLVSFEPNTASPTIINDLRNGVYDTILAAYFQNLKNTGISSKQLGTWILFPEANTPTWHNTDPTTFVTNVSKLATIQRKAFPGCKLTILLNNTTYPSNDEDWSHGTKKDLRPYVSTIPSGTLDSFGYQGFPFVSPKDAAAQYGQLDAKDFLQLTDARDAANALHTKNIWLNTGTFRNAHTGTEAEKVTLSTTQRQKTLDSIARQTISLKDQGFTVSVNIFAKDKSTDGEHIDWSYWPTGKYTDSQDTPLLKTFFEQLHKHSIDLSLHDAI